MEDEKIILLLERALNKLIEVDSWLLTHNINEPCISHRIALHLTQRFNGYDVDCEYNGDVERTNQRKRINFIADHIEQTNNENLLTEEESREVSVFPDIIIHRRGSNNYNLCIIEVKKRSNSNKDFDRIKLQSYTSQNYGNNLNYQLGIFIIITADTNNPSYELEYYKNGSRHIIN